MRTESTLDAPSPMLWPVPPVRARLWLRGREFGERYEGLGGSRLWLHLQDGRVLAFRLPEACYQDDAVIAPLVEAVAEDARGEVLEIRDSAFGVALPLYAAPIVPRPARSRSHPPSIKIRRFAAGIDARVLALLGRLENGCFLSSVRNYNRLATLPAGLRERRLQALDRFPLLVVPILLTRHRGPDFIGDKRFAWREPDPTVIEAIDHGRALTGALARRYGISKGLVRSPLCRALWNLEGEAAGLLLRVFDAIPAHRRPQNIPEIERHVDSFLALPRRIRTPTDARRLASAFKDGWSTVWERCEARFAPLPPALHDARDFLAAAVAGALDAVRLAYPIDPESLGLAWIAARGIVSLLAASRRWHAFLDGHGAQIDGEVIRAILGNYAADAGRARELICPAELAREGEAMHHCVAHYWHKCVTRGTRIFHLALRDGERATAEYRFDAHRETKPFVPVQLRGPCNAEPSRAMHDFASEVQTALTAAERLPAREALATQLAHQMLQAPARRNPPRALDPASERELACVLDYLAHQPDYRPLPGEVLRALVAGYQYHAGPGLEAGFAVGDALTLAREPDNPYDPLAVRIDWRGEKLGYVPRGANRAIARGLDGGERLVCRISGLDRAAEAWARLEFVSLKEELPCPNPST